MEVSCCNCKHHRVHASCGAGISKCIDREYLYWEESEESLSKRMLEEDRVVKRIVNRSW